MGLHSKLNFILRSTILIVATLLTLFAPNIVDNILNFNLIFNMSIVQVFWVFLMYEMIVVLIPSWNKFSYCGKHLDKHYIPVANYDKEKLKEYTKKSNFGALRALIFWITVNGILFYIYIKFNLHVSYAYSLFIFYYWSDMFCVNIWCPFNKIIVRNNCCNECRIYNWGHIMYVTPLLLVPSFWSYSLVITALIICLQWEYQYIRYPERFSPISNKSLRCTHCKNTCRFNKNKSKALPIKQQ